MKVWAHLSTYKNCIKVDELKVSIVNIYTVETLTYFEPFQIMPVNECFGSFDH